jgi:hypothetical protein
MAVTAAEQNPAPRASRTTRREARKTTLDSHLDKPQITEPGDAPYDTTDPTERASSVEPDKAAAVLAGHGVVNAVVKLPEPATLETESGEERVETYDALTPDGRKVTVTHNIDTGESSTG